jgi:membrane protein YqaA with SNARE-associated domain
MREAMLQAPLLLCLLALVVGLVSSLSPISPTEPILLGLAAFAPTPLLLLVVVLATVGHMAAKTVVYLGSRSAAPVVPARHRARLQQVRALVARRPGVQRLTVLVSALSSVPPFYLVTVCCGVVRMPLRDYVVAGTIGRALRFGALALLPRLLGV